MRRRDELAPDLRVREVSTDAEIATLAREAPHDPWARYRWRCALVRSGRGAEAGFEEGDEVEVAAHRPWDGEGDPLPEELVCVLGRRATLVARQAWARLEAVEPSMTWGCASERHWTLLKPRAPK